MHTGTAQQFKGIFKMITDKTRHTFTEKDRGKKPKLYNQKLKFFGFMLPGFMHRRAIDKGGGSYLRKLIHRDNLDLPSK